MIKILAIHIQDFRGIKKLTLDLKGKNFAICGRNGTGKSGIVDAIEFGLTGNISRLSGEGTDKLSVREHGPHVDMRNDPEKASVKLVVEIASLPKTVTIVRSPKEPNKPTVTPSTAAILGVLKQIEDHPEIVLTRREIIRYVLAPEGKRATEVQAVLRLESLGQNRQMLKSIANAYAREAAQAKTSTVTATTSLKQAMGIATLTPTTVLLAVNKRRKVLGLAPIAELASTTSLKEGVGIVASTTTSSIAKDAAAKDVAALSALLERLSVHTKDAQMVRALTVCQALANDTAMLSMLTREEFYRTGSAFIDQELCPFCDEEWSITALRAHIATKMTALQKAKLSRARAEKAIEPVILLLEELLETLQRVGGYARATKPAIATTHLALLKKSLTSAKQSLTIFLPLDRTVGVLEAPPELNPAARKELVQIAALIDGLPEPSKEQEARDFLLIVQERLGNYRRAKRAQERLEERATLAAKVSQTYASVVDTELNKLYKVVEADFAQLYGELNAPDEAGFAAELVPSIGKLGFGVNFYGRGMFPPGAYHSEGHQDAMGLCLYLALMSHVLKGGFQLAVLDDVLMSVDAGHRRAICTMLKKRFPNTQFILTTHDPVWLNHMRTEELVTAKASVRFRGWDVNVGPTSFDDADVWTEIEKELIADRVSVAAELLRNHLEYVAGELCHRLSARTEHRLDERFELGMLLPPAYEQLLSLYGKANRAANSWNQRNVVAAITERQRELVESYKATSIDQWQMNAAIHYNGWATLQKEDFGPLVAAFKALIERFRCAHCQTFFVLLKEAGKAKSLACDCGQQTLNLAAKE